MTNIPCSDVRFAAASLRGAASQPVPARPGALRAEGVTAWFGRRCIVAGVDLEMRAGRVTSIIGRPGCGKSTFLRTLNRLHELVPSAALAGEVSLDGADIYAAGSRPALLRLQVGMVFPRPNPFPATSIAENMVAGLRLAGIPRRDRPAMAERFLARAGLWDEVKGRLGEPAGALTAGQQQRLCIARSLAVGPRVLLMDEPCATVDPASSRHIEETIREISRSVTVVIATTDIGLAARVSDDAAYLQADRGWPGRVVEFGPTGDLLNAPKDPRTEDYVQGR